MSLYESLAKGLNEAIEFERGKVSLRSNTLSISEPEEFSANDIKAIRTRTGLSQAAFAAAMGVSKKTVEAWEAGRNTPSGTAKRLLAIAEEDPEFFEKEGIVSFGKKASEESFKLSVRNERSDGRVEWHDTIASFGWRKQYAGGMVYGTGC